MGGRRWTNDEIQTLEDMSGTYTVATIARRLGRSFDSVNLKMNRLGILGFENRFAYHEPALHHARSRAQDCEKEMGR